MPPNGSAQGFWPLLAYGAPPPKIDAECAPRSVASVLRAPQPPLQPHSPILHPLAAQSRPHTQFARLTATLPLIARVCAGAQRCPLTLTRVEFGAPRWRFGDCLAQAGREGAQAPGGWPGDTLGGDAAPQKRSKKGSKKPAPHWWNFLRQFGVKSYETGLCSRFVGSRRAVKRPV